MFVSSSALEDRAEPPGILHADLDSFFSSVEQRDDPKLRGRPVAVGGGIIVAASYEAKAFGIRTPMGGAQARALCPGLIVVPGRFAEYSEASRRVFEIFRDTTPLVEGISIDEAFLDVRGLRRSVGSAPWIAERLRRRVADEVGLPITVGVARTKFLAKVASAAAKPDGLLVVPVDGERAFLHPLPVERLWGVGKVTSAKLHAVGIDTVGRLAATDLPTLTSLLGSHGGGHLLDLANLRDPRRVTVGRRRRSIGAQRALGRGVHTVAEIYATLIALVERVAGRMRKAGRAGRTVVLRLRFADFERVTRSRTLSSATDSTEEILAAVRGLITAARPLIVDRGITLVGISVTNIGDDEQPTLPFADDTGPAIDSTVDAIRSKFGTDAVRRGVLVGRHTGYSMPTLPDD